MKCPYCNQEISDPLISRHLGSRGGKKSRRTLTSEQARDMARKSAEVRHKKQKHTKNYEAGSFDGRTDLYAYDILNGDLPQVKYVLSQRTSSDIE